MISPQHSVFLLGGRDLEMITIKAILLRHGFSVLDRGLSWADSVLSSYKEVFLRADEDLVIYGIELTDDMDCKDSRYVRIDHHNESSWQASSLEQVAALLEYTLTREEQLIAANDKGYIPAMKQMGATHDEIDDIRSRDRKAQGCTEKDEMSAMNAVNAADTSFPGIIFVAADSKRFSPITDLLYKAFPSHSWVIHTDSEICTYGSIVPRFRELFQSSEALYSGGGDYGYAGLSSLGNESMDHIFALIKSMKPVSKHIFLFPFRYNRNGAPNPQLFKRVQLGNESEQHQKALLFNERQYFYPFTHNTFYDCGDSSHVQHFEGIFGQGIYRIFVDDSHVYELSIEYMNVHLYDTGVGILSLYLANTAYTDPEDILFINQFGRRIMRPNFGRYELAKSLELTFPNQSLTLTDCFDSESVWTPSTIIDGLLSPLEVKPVIDDRMFVVCWMKSEKEINRLKGNTYEFVRDQINDGIPEGEPKDFWYRFLFVDGKEATCQSDRLYSDLLKRSTYTRWEEENSIYGISRYSMVLLTGDTPPDYVLDTFETIYLRIAELVIVRRASSLLFTQQVGGVMNQTTHDKERLLKNYQKYENNYCFRDITAQDQGIETYDLLMDQLELKDYEDRLEKEIAEVHRLANLASNERQSNQSVFLNIIAGLALPATTLFSIAGVISPSITCQSAIWLGVISFVLSVIILVFVWRKGE